MNERVMSGVVGRTHPGLRVSSSEPRMLRSGSFVIPYCDQHGMAMTELSDLPNMELREGHTVSVCPRCFRDKSGEVNVETVESEIANAWDAYGVHFEAANPPLDTSEL